MLKKKKVEKMLSPEEMTLVSNIGSLVEEILQMGAGAGAPPAEDMPPEPAKEEPVMQQEMPMTETGMEEEESEGKEVKMILKGIETTPSESSTASDDAEERIEEPLPEETEDNVMDVEKAVKLILTAIAGQKQVKKSKPKDPVTQAIEKLVEIQKASQSQMDELSTAFGHVLDGLGVAKQLEIAEASQKQPARKINKSANEELLNALNSIVGNKVEKAEEETHKSQGDVVRKNLGDVNNLIGMVGNGVIPGNRTF